MPQFRKRPVEIEARKLTAASADEIEKWMDGEGRIHRDTNENLLGLTIPTLEGMMTADVGDFVIKGVKGEFYPCKPDIFEATYDAIESPTPV